MRIVPHTSPRRGDDKPVRRTNLLRIDGGDDGSRATSSTSPPSAQLSSARFAYIFRFHRLRFGVSNSPRFVSRGKHFGLLLRTSRGIRNRAETFFPVLSRRQFSRRHARDFIRLRAPFVRKMRMYKTYFNAYAHIFLRSDVLDQRHSCKFRRVEETLI